MIHDCNGENLTNGCAAKPGFWSKFWRFMHLLTWGVSFGTAVWMTFMSGRVLSQSMPGEQFRQVQTKMFPSYLRFLTSAEGSLTFLYMLMSIASKWQILNLLILTSTTAYNAYVLEPETTNVCALVDGFSYFCLHLSLSMLFYPFVSEDR